jgi:hypothetical protein
MAVPAPKRRLIQHGFGENLAVRHHNGHFRTKAGQLLLERPIPAHPFRGEHR